MQELNEIVILKLSILSVHLMSQSVSSVVPFISSPFSDRAAVRRIHLNLQEEAGIRYGPHLRGIFLGMLYVRLILAV